nr:SMI1/KNR4 family protein [Micromonospora sp. DSM 115978]
MQPDVDQSWDLILNWLGRHSPAEAALIRPPADPRDIDAAAHAVDTGLPADLVAWWRRADGQDGKGQLLPPLYSPYAVRAALGSRDIWLTAWNPAAAGPDPDRFAAWVADLDRAPAGTPCQGAWLPSWLPIAGDGGGNDLFVDLRSGPAHGCVREFRRHSGALDEVLWDSVAAMLAEVAVALRHGVPVRGDRQIWVYDDGTICWDTALGRWSAGGSALVLVNRLRERYAEVAVEVHTGGFAVPEGTWPAEFIAAHVVRNTELLVVTTEALLAGEPDPVYDNSDAMDPATLQRYAAAGLGALADRISYLSSRLCELAEPLNRGRPVAHVRVLDEGRVIVDGRQGWLGVLNALWNRQLPIRTRQLRALR